MLLMQAFDKPSPKQPLGQRREFIPCRRSAVSPRATIVSHKGLCRRDSGTLNSATRTDWTWSQHASSMLSLAPPNEASSLSIT
jgi:hypothetical protein